jgi:hypothetical protein
MTFSKRQILLALAAIGAGAALPASAQQTTALDISEGRAIGQAYLAANPGVNLIALRAELLPNGLDTARLRTLVAADFGAARVFIFKGWRLSETEVRLFALLAASP